MATKEELLIARIRINDQDAENKLEKMKQQFQQLKKKRDEAVVIS